MHRPPISPPRPRFALLPRPLAGAVQVIAPERPAREPAPILFFAGVISCTGKGISRETIPDTALLPPHPSRRRPSGRPQGLIATRDDLPALCARDRSFKWDITL